MSRRREDDCCTKVQEEVKMGQGESWFDRGGVGLLMYAVTADEFHVVSELLQMLKRDFKEMNTLDVLSHEFEMRDMFHLEFREVRRR